MFTIVLFQLERGKKEG